MKKININEATGPQLVAFAQGVLNIEGIRPNMAKAEMIAKIRSVGYDQETIEVEEAAPASTAVSEGTKASGEKMVRIMIPSEDKPGGDQHVPVGNNGSVMLIPRNLECDIPYRFFTVLRDAVREVYDPLPEGGLGPARKVPAYPFQVLSV